MEADPFADTHREPANSPLRPCDRVGKIDLPLLAASPCAALAAYFLCMGLRIKKWIPRRAVSTDPSIEVLE